MTEKIWRFYVAKCMYARKRARMHVCAFFAKCLKWPETYAKLILNESEHYKILMRAYVRVKVRAQNLLTFLVELWPEVDVCQIWFIFDDSLSRYDNDLIFTKWRLDDVTIWLEIIELDDWQKFEGNWPCRFRVNVRTKKCTEEIKIKNKENSSEINRWSVIDRPPNK